jgi:fructose-1,6-bisphosphatase I/sedoheptulose-1,7-bisphosphatase
MGHHNYKTLAQYLMEQSRERDALSPDLVGLLLDVAQACKTISRTVAFGSLGGAMGKLDSTNVQGETQAKLDVLSCEIFRENTEFTGHISGVASEEMDDPHPVPAPYPRGDYLLLYDPLDGSSNIDVNVSVGSIFSILKAPKPGEEPTTGDFLQSGRHQVAAGYTVYGPSTKLVLSVGAGVVGFTLDPLMGDFFLTRPEMTVLRETQEFAVNASNGRFWEPPVKRYVAECVAGHTGPRGKDFNMRWIASLVAEAHRILVRGGVFMYPKDNKVPGRAGRLRLMYEANPISFLMEQAGGKATTGLMPVLDVEPTELHQRVPFIFGSAEEVEVIEAYHREKETNVEDIFETPLFNQRGLFRAVG